MRWAVLSKFHESGDSTFIITTDYFLGRPVELLLFGFVSYINTAASCSENIVIVCVIVDEQEKSTALAFIKLIICFLCVLIGRFAAKVISCDNCGINELFLVKCRGVSIAVCNSFS